MNHTEGINSECICLINTLRNYSAWVHAFLGEQVKSAEIMWETLRECVCVHIYAILKLDCNLKEKHYNISSVH